MLKKVLIFFAGFILLAILGFYFYINSGIDLPEKTDAVIEELLNKNDLPDLISGETGITKSGDVKIWYEKLNPKDSIKGTVLLVMGHSSSALLWGKSFYQPFVDAGYQVVRYDNRGTGLSDWVHDWDETQPFTLEDMAKDVIAILDAIGVKKAHIIGASMGGMIAQRLAISHGDRVASLTSIMSSADMNDPDIAPISSEFTQNFIKLGLKYLLPPSEEGRMKFAIGVQKMLKGSGNYTPNISVAATRTLYEMRKRSGYNLKVSDQHTAAITASGSRLAELKNIRAPTLVIHGKTDPLVNFAHAKKYAPLIPNARTLYIDGMGHDLPEIYLDQIHGAIFKLIRS